MVGLKGSEVTGVGAYELHANNVRHVGFIRRDEQGNLYGYFTGADGTQHGVAVEIADGLFYPSALIPLEGVGDGL